MIDSQALFLAGLACHLDSEPRVRMVACTTKASELRSCLDSHEADVLVVGVHDEGAGLDLVSDVVRGQLVPGVVALIADDDIELAAQALQRGARGVVSRLDTIDELIAAVLDAYQGMTRLPARLLGGVVSRLHHTAQAEEDLSRRVELLTPREREVLGLLASGADRQSIAEQLFISVHTVRTHIQRVLTKLGAHSQLEAVSVALRAGVRPPGG